LSEGHFPACLEDMIYHNNNRHNNKKNDNNNNNRHYSNNDNDNSHDNDNYYNYNYNDNNIDDSDNKKIIDHVCVWLFLYTHMKGKHHDRIAYDDCQKAT